MFNPSNNKHENIQVLEIKTSIDKFNSLITFRKIMSDKTSTLDTQNRKQGHNTLQYLYTKMKQLKNENTALCIKIKNKAPKSNQFSSFTFFNTQTYLQKLVSSCFAKLFKNTIL
jgi:hypothetical protein